MNTSDPAFSDAFTPIQRDFIAAAIDEAMAPYRQFLQLEKASHEAILRRVNDVVDQMSARLTTMQNDLARACDMAHRHHDDGAAG